MKNTKTLSPICLFTYNRVSVTKKTITALKNNFLSSKSELFIFSDGWKKNNENDEDKVEEVRDYLNTIKGFQKITIFNSDKNKGLSKSIIEGVTKVVNVYDKVIVLEDDLLTSPNFLNYMNETLDYYSNNNKIFSISGYTLNLDALSNLSKDVYLGVRASSWGWGTWKNRWENVDWEVKDYNSFKKSFISRYNFNKGGSDMCGMLKNQMNGKIDSWAIRFCYDQFKKNQYTVFPKISKLISIGFGKNATHTKSINRFKTVLDTSNKVKFLFEDNMNLDRKVTAQFKNKFSIVNRIKDRLGWL